MHACIQYTCRSALVELLNELFPASLPQLTQHMHVVVLLDQDCFSVEDRKFFETHPAYRQIVTYLRGSVLAWSDLVRASADQPELQAAIVLADQRNEPDTNNLMRCVALRRLLPDVQLFVMLRHSKNLEYVLASGVSEHHVVLNEDTRFGK